ncbi:MAG TPA: hypothetical protein VD999_03075 [Vitreimonas sp.]|nr:hypothetical protein [Vitreimonas sp.]
MFKEGKGGLPSEILALHDLIKNSQQFITDRGVNFESYVSALQSAGFFELRLFDTRDLSIRPYQTSQDQAAYKERSQLFRLAIEGFYQAELVTAFMKAKIQQGREPQGIICSTIPLDFNFMAPSEDYSLDNWAGDPLVYRQRAQQNYSKGKFSFEMYLATRYATVFDPAFYVSFYMFEGFLADYREQQLRAMTKQGISQHLLTDYKDSTAFKALLSGNYNYFIGLMPGVVHAYRKRILSVSQPSDHEKYFLPEDFKEGIEYAFKAGVFQHYLKLGGRSICSADRLLTDVMPQILPSLYLYLRSGRVCKKTHRQIEIVQHQARGYIYAYQAYLDHKLR